MSNTRKATDPPVDVDALLDSAEMPERTVAVCLRGNLYAEFQAAEEELGQALLNQAGMGEDPQVEVLRDRVRDVQDRMRAGTLTLTVRAIPKPDFDALLLAHPPRDDHPRDAQNGFNRDAVNDALIRACIVTPEMTDARWGKLIKVLVTAQYQQVLEAVNAVNFTPVDVPFSYAASVKSPDSDES